MKGVINMPLPFWVYTSSSIIIKKLGRTGLTIVAALIAKGAISTSKDLKKFIGDL